MPRAQVDRKEGATAMHDEDGPSVREAREENRLEDRSIWIMLLCGFPLIYFAVAYPSLTTLIIFQAYILTFTVAGMLGIKKRAVLKQKWFLNAMACSLPIHLVAIAGIFFWDKANLEVAFKGFYTVGVVWLACVIEMVVIVVIMEFWEHRRTRIDSE